MGMKRRGKLPTEQELRLMRVNHRAELASVTTTTEREIKRAERRIRVWKRRAGHARDQLKKAEADLSDARNATQTVFSRCACGRLKEQGVVCPTNQEGGDCEAGR